MSMLIPWAEGHMGIIQYRVWASAETYRAIKQCLLCCSIYEGIPGKPELPQQVCSRHQDPMVAR